MGFQHALWHIAEKKGIDAEAVLRRVALLGSGGPILNGTKAEMVRFYDDKSTYTGTHLHGGPDVGPSAKASDSEVWRSLLRPEIPSEGRQPYRPVEVPLQQCGQRELSPQ